MHIYTHTLRIYALILYTIAASYSMHSAADYIILYIYYVHMLYMYLYTTRRMCAATYIRTRASYAAACILYI